MYADFNYGISLYGVSAGNRLTGNDKIIYNLLKTKIEAVAAGRESSTVFTITAGDLGIATEWTKDSLGIDIYSNGITQAAKDAISAKVCM